MAYVSRIITQLEHLDVYAAVIKEGLKAAKELQLLKYARHAPCLH